MHVLLEYELYRVWTCYLSLVIIGVAVLGCVNVKEVGRVVGIAIFQPIGRAIGIGIGGGKGADQRSCCHIFGYAAIAQGNVGRGRGERTDPHPPGPLPRLSFL